MAEETEAEEAAARAEIEEHCSAGVEVVTLDSEAAGLVPVAMAGPPRAGDNLVQNDVKIIAESLAQRGYRVCLYYGDLRFRNYTWWQVEGE